MSHDQNNKNCEKNKFHRCIAAVCHHKRDCTCPVERVDGQGQPMPFDYAPQERAEKPVDIPKCCDNDTRMSGRHKCLKSPPQEPLRELNKERYYEMWNEGEFSWNKNPHNAINPERIWQSFIEPFIAQQIARAEELGFKKAGLSCKLDHENAALQARKAVVEEIGKYNAFILNEYQKRHGFTDQIMVAILTDGMNKYFPLEQGLITLGDNFSQESK